MRRGEAPRPGKREAGERGFTLIEVMVVLAVLGLLAGLVLFRGPPRSAALELRGAVSTVSGSLRLARSRAIASNQPVPVLLDEPGEAVAGAATGHVTVAGAAPRSLPRGVSLTLLVPPTVPGGRITFLPDGSATGGTVVLRTAGLSARVGVDWLSGNVSVIGGGRDGS